MQAAGVGPDVVGLAAGEAHAARQASQTSRVGVSAEVESEQGVSAFVFVDSGSSVYLWSILLGFAGPAGPLCPSCCLGVDCRSSPPLQLALGF